MVINKKKWIWYVIPIVITAFLIAVTTVTHNIEENSINEAFLENQIELQQTVTDSIAKNISSEIKLILVEMKVLSNSDELQNDLGTDESNELARKTFDTLNSIAPTAQIILIDENFEVIFQVSSHHRSWVGMKVPWLDSFLNENPSLIEPIISTFDGPPKQGPEIAIISHVVDEETNLSKGTIMITFPSDRFFARHGNIYDVDSQFITVIDKDYTILVTPTDELIGENVYGKTAQEYLGNNQLLNKFAEKLFEGNQAYVIYDFGFGERLNTGSPITINGKDEFFLSVITPTNIIYDEVNQIISLDKIQTSALIIVMTIILGILLFKRTKIFEQEKLATIGHLSSNIAHDMRNPLGAISSSSKRIENQNKNKNQIINDEVSRINRSVKRMSHQVEGVLNYVRTTPIIPTKKSVREMLNYALDVVQVPENIQVSLPENDITIECDSEKMEIVFVNLILNAVQAIDKDKGNISIKLSGDSSFLSKIPKSEVKIQFENSGPPIPNDKLSEIFKPLFTTKLKGTGLGLSGCKNIVEQHKGVITVTPNPVTFTIYLPKRLFD